MGAVFDIQAYEGDDAVTRAMDYYVKAPLSAYDIRDEVGEFMNGFAGGKDRATIPDRYDHVYRGRSPDSRMRMTPRPVAPFVAVETATCAKAVSTVALRDHRVPEIFRRASLVSAAFNEESMLVKDHRDRSGLTIYSGVQVPLLLVTEGVGRWNQPHLNSHELSGRVGRHPKLGFRSIDRALSLATSKSRADIRTACIASDLTKINYQLEFRDRLFDILGIPSEVRQRMTVQQADLTQRPPKQVAEDDWVVGHRERLFIHGVDQTAATVRRTFDAPPRCGDHPSDGDVTAAILGAVNAHASLTKTDLVAHVAWLFPGRVHPAYVGALVDLVTTTPDGNLPILRSSTASLEHLRKAGDLIAGAVNDRITRSLLKDLKGEKRLCHMFGDDRLKSRARLEFILATDAQWERLVLESPSPTFDASGRAPALVRLGPSVTAVNVTHLAPSAAHELIQTALHNAGRVVVVGAGPERGCPRELTNLGLLERYSGQPANYLTRAPKIPRPAVALDLPAPRVLFVEEYPRAAGSPTLMGESATLSQAADPGFASSGLAPDSSRDARQEPRGVDPIAAAALEWAHRRRKRTMDLGKAVANPPQKAEHLDVPSELVELEPGRKEADLGPALTPEPSTPGGIGSDRRGDKHAETTAPDAVHEADKESHFQHAVPLSGEDGQKSSPPEKAPEVLSVAPSHTSGPAAKWTCPEDFVDANARIATNNRIAMSITDDKGIHLRADLGVVPPDKSVWAAEFAAAFLQGKHGRQIGRVLSSENPIASGRCGASVNSNGNLALEAWFPSTWFSGGTTPSDNAQRVFAAFVSCVADLNIDPDLQEARNNARTASSAPAGEKLNPMDEVEALMPETADLPQTRQAEESDDIAEAERILAAELSSSDGDQPNTSLSRDDLIALFGGMAHPSFRAAPPAPAMGAVASLYTSVGCHAFACILQGVRDRSRINIDELVKALSDLGNVAPPSDASIPDATPLGTATREVLMAALDVDVARIAIGRSPDMN